MLHDLVTRYVGTRPELFLLSPESRLRPVRLMLDVVATSALQHIAFDPRSLWRLNYRDIEQSAERLILRAVFGLKPAQVSREPGEPLTLRITKDHVRAEHRILLSRWEQLNTVHPLTEQPPDDGPPPWAPLSPHHAPIPAPQPSGRWDELRDAFANPKQVDSLCEHDRVLALFVLRAHRVHPNSMAAAGRWLLQHNLVSSATSSDAQSNAFKRKWSQFPWSKDPLTSHPGPILTPQPPARWDELRGAFRDPAAVDALSEHERYLALFLLRAYRAHPGNKAAAWAWLRKRGLLKGGDANASDAFKTKWAHINSRATWRNKLQ